MRTLFLLLALGFAAQAQAGVAPVLTGTPKTTATVGTNYWFLGTCTDADADGDALRLGIVNKPAWMGFNSTNGAVWGTPPLAAAGVTYSNIKINCTDGTYWRSIVWTLEVQATTTTNHPPSISGTVRTNVEVGKNYYFKPQASDPDGDKLAFGVANKPAWLRFAASDGSLWGVPTAADVGAYPNIVISVADGKTDVSVIF
jgi:hypothetical protein